MSRRGRAVAFLALAALAAATAAAMVSRYGSSVAQGYGPLRRVVVLRRELPPGRTILPRVAASAFEVRRVPARFVPSGALASPRDAVGLAPEAELPAGSYLLGQQLRPPGSKRERRSRPLPGGRRPVQISVSGAEALLAAGPPSPGLKVDVVVTTEPRGPGPGRTYVAAAAVPLLALAPRSDDLGAGGAAAATLGLTKPQALRLIEAESFARKLTLLPRYGVSGR